MTHLDQDAPTPAQPVRPPKWAAVLLSVACTAVAGVLFLPVSTAVAVAAGASLFGQPERGPDEWWFPYAMFVFVTVAVVSFGAAFVLSRRRLRYAALPLLALLALIAMVPVLAWLTAPEIPLGDVAQHLAHQPLGAPTGRGFGAVTVRSNGFQNIDVFDVNSGAVIGSLESSTTPVARSTSNTPKRGHPSVTRDTPGT